MNAKSGTKKSQNDDHEVADSKAIIDYIKTQKWFFSTRTDDSLLFYSAKAGGYKRLKREYGTEFAETMLVPIRKNHLTRVFNLSQAKDFHALSNDKIQKNPAILQTYIKKDDEIYQKIKLRGNELLAALKNEDYASSVKLFDKVLSLYERASADFIIIFSLGLKLTENINNLNNVGDIVKLHDSWRNSVAFKEEEMGESLFEFFNYLTNKKKLKVAPLSLMKFLTLGEARAWLNKELTDEEIVKRLVVRENYDFIYLNLRGEGREFIDDQKSVEEISKYFLTLYEASEEPKQKGRVSGQTANTSMKPVMGRVVVIKEKNDLRSKGNLIQGKILVAIQTTPHFIPYMKSAKGIITDEGGLTCHAAIIARELRIPCIVGTKNATKTLKDGDLIEMATDSGKVRVIKRKQ